MNTQADSTPRKRSFLCTSLNNINVYYDPLNSHAATHFQGTSQLKTLVIEALSGMNLTENEIASQFDMKRVVGTCDVVAVDDADEIVYALRQNCEQDGLVPFVKRRVGLPCETIALHVIKQPDGTYLLSSAWIGTFGGDDEPFPLSPNPSPRSIDYWNRHSFVWGSQPIVPGSETSTCPWR